MIADKLRVLAIGAHPDNAELSAGGLALLYRDQGHEVRFLSLTNGDAGHHTMSRPALAERRRQEARAAAQSAGIISDVLDVHDGELEPSLAMRGRLIRLIRQARPDLLLCHRPNDYHPDHRGVGMLVQDAAYLLMVPLVEPSVPPLMRMPVVGYVWDAFQRPAPFQPTVAVDIGPVFDRKCEMAHCHTSQMYEWLPHVSGHSAEVPAEETERRAWLRRGMEPHSRRIADSCRSCLERWYGMERGRAVQWAEAVEVSEYGAPLPDEEAARLFPFFGA